MAYELIALLTDRSDVDLKGLLDLLRNEFAADLDAEVRMEKHPLTEEFYVAVRWGDWSFRLSYEDEGHVREESQEIAETYAGSRPDRYLIAACRRRISMTADEDPAMDHFNDYCFIMQRLSEQAGVVLFDPKGPEFTEV